MPDATHDGNGRCGRPLVAFCATAHTFGAFHSHSRTTVGRTAMNGPGAPCRARPGAGVRGAFNGARGPAVDPGDLPALAGEPDGVGLVADPMPSASSPVSGP